MTLTRGHTARRVLYWVYASRMVVVLAVYGSALAVGRDWLYRPTGFTELSVRALAVTVLVATALVTTWSYWFSHHRDEPPNLVFTHMQAAFDILIVTGVVLLTGGSDSVFPPLLYIALVSGYALIAPLFSSLLIAATTAVAYLAVVGLAYPEQLGLAVLLQAAIIGAVALVSGVIGGRLRQLGQELTNVERELQRLRIRTADILHTIEAAIVTVDDEGRAIYVNPAAAPLIGLQPEESIGETVIDRLAERAPAIASVIRETLERDRPIKSREIEVIGPGEEGPIPYSVSTALLEREGAPKLVTIVLHDLQMARQLEELHLRASRLGVVAELSASLAHEIKNPLASIRSAVEQIADPDAAADDRETLARLVVREADRLSRLLGEFNDFARVDVAERKPIDLERTVREAVELVAQRPEARDRAAFDVELARGLDDLWGDPDLIHRTLTNLLLNAVQVSDAEKPVNVRIVADAMSPELAPSAIGSGMPIRIRVIDDGPGIAPDDVGRIFDPFYTRRQGGSGMGLAIAHRAVQAHGGALLVSSRPGQGATFAMILPRRRPKRRAKFTEAGGDERVEARLDDDPEFAKSRSLEESPALDGLADRLA